MRLLLLVLLMMRAFGFLTLALLFHGSAATVPKAATNGHSSFISHPPVSSVHKHYRSGRHKHFHFAHIPTVHLHSQSPSSSPAQSPSPLREPTLYTIPILSPSAPPIGSSLHDTLSTPPSSTILSLPYPPHNTDCSSISCSDPLTYATSGSPCGCVLPIKVKLQLNVALYTFFPLVSVLAREIAASANLKRSQVRIMGADEADQQPDKTTVQVYLIPMGKEFNQTTAMSTYLKFWHKQVLVDNKQFGAYDVLYVHYPGLPLSPPSPLSSDAAVVKGPNNGSGVHGMPLKPLGVAIPETKRKDNIRGSSIIIIALSSFTLFSICAAFAAVLLCKHRCCSHQRDLKTPESLLPLRPSVCSRTGSTTLSFSSSTRTYTGTARTFSYEDIEKATDNFNHSSILGEGGFGLVYSGVLCCLNDPFSVTCLVQTQVLIS